MTYGIQDPSVRFLSIAISCGCTHRRKPLDACMLDGNDEWRLGRVGDLEVEVWFSKRHQPSYDGHTADVEEQDSDIDSANGFRQISAWILRFSCSNLEY